ncbi:MAG: hypothetical protein M1829_004708 [Trizodia sp. TS-e1964]|nr:MAG: hypothetical protein M1829_004708 [Trizodia sp. TS-e1964]
MAALQLIDALLGPRNPLARLVQKAGPQSTATHDACREMLKSAAPTKFDESQVAAALLFMVIFQGPRRYSPSIFVSEVRPNTLIDGFEWQKVIQDFDREGLKVDKDQLLSLYDALLPVALEVPSFDIQLLWGGEWKHPETQLSFVTAFSSLSTNQLNISAVPRLRKAFKLVDFVDAPDPVKEYASKVTTHPFISLDAVAAIFRIVLHSNETYMAPEGQRVFQEFVQPNIDIFLLTAFGIPRPWTDTQQDIAEQYFNSLLHKQQPNYSFVLHGLWKQDKQWVALRLVEKHAHDPKMLSILLEHSQEHHWLDDLIMILNGFGLDLVALAHRRRLVDLEQWALASSQRGHQEFAFAVSKFLTIKAEDEMRTFRKEQESPRTYSLAVRTVNALLEILEDLLADERREDLVILQRLCIQAYPRLINYGEGLDEVIDANGEDSNGITEEADIKMQDYYKRMYSAELDVREVVEAMKRLKQSPNSAEQDLFACMIHGLFDEYSCYQGYPLEALATTAVLFGGIINFNLISGIPLRVGLGMILEAVRDYSPEEPMYKFGLQALLHFFGRLSEWPGFCNMLIQVPGLHGTEAYAKAVEIVREREEQMAHGPETNGVASPPNGISTELTLTNGHLDHLFPPEPIFQKFQSIHVDDPLRPGLYEDPDEEVHDKVLFVLNNVSERNLESKLNDLRGALEEKHHQWFAGYLVEERAKMQPNFHQLYLDLLQLFGDKTLWAEVLRETYVSVIRMLNAESTMQSSTERSYLKNLGGWLGSLTIARDKPLKFRNISFKDLLIEGYDTQRLIVVIPFTCKVLTQATKSTVFKPPNPWMMDIIKLLIELYHFAELKLNLKFEIEVLCKSLSLDHSSIEPATGIRERPHLEDDLSLSVLPDGLTEGFDELTVPGLNRQIGRNDRFSPDSITSSLPELNNLLVYPPTSGNSVNSARQKQVIHNAIQRAIFEIISPVVERSVTIAAISTAQLIHKDFAMEPDEERVRESAQTMVKALAGSLALVTSKEPLRMSMSNYIRMMQSEVPDQPLAEGTIIMCVNDNLDIACSMVERAAEQRAIPEINENIEQQLAERRIHLEMRPNDPYVDQAMVNRWAFYIPEPFKQAPGGLNQDQMAIYKEFARQSRGASLHAPSSSDIGRQMVQDVTQESFPAIQNIPTPAEPPAIPHQSLSQQSRAQPPMPSATPPQLNGFTDAKTLIDRVNGLLSDLQQITKDSSQQHIKDLSRGSPAAQMFEQILSLIIMSPHREEASLSAANKICMALYTQTDTNLEIEALVGLLAKLCKISSVTAKEVILWMANQDDERVFNVAVTISLLEAGLLELHRVDKILAKAIQSRKIVAVEFLSKLMDEVLLNERPTALRADFAGSLEAVGQWLADEPDMSAGKALLEQLRYSGIPGVLQPLLSDGDKLRQDQMEYVFTEWVRLCGRPSTTERSYAAFIALLHQKQIINDENESCLFFRLCIDISVEAYEHQTPAESGRDGAGFICVDALAKLVVLLVRFQGEAEGEVKGNKASYLKSILSLIILLLNHHHVMRGEAFNQKVFFRLYSSILCEYHALEFTPGGTQDTEIMLAFAENLLTLQPAYFPGFLLGWMSLISHRNFTPLLLYLPNQVGWAPFAKIMECLLSYVGELLKPLDLDPIAKDVYRGVLRIFLVLHHDFPEFLAENHFKLCSITPAHCTQLRNLVLSAYPSSFPELPDPFTAGLKVDRLAEIKNSPVIEGDVEGPLVRANIKHIVDRAMADGGNEQEVLDIVAAVHSSQSLQTSLGNAPITVNVEVVNSLVIYVGMHAISTLGNKAGSAIMKNSPQAVLLEKLVAELHLEARYYFLSAIANHLRYPNSHTHFFSYALLFLFGSDPIEDGTVVREQITRVLLERLIVHRPHPWGLIVTLLELLKNPIYMFWDLPFIKAAPEIERLFGALFQHINQSPL